MRYNLALESKLFLYQDLILGTLHCLIASSLSFLGSSELKELCYQTYTILLKLAYSLTLTARISVSGLICSAGASTLLISSDLTLDSFAF